MTINARPVRIPDSTREASARNQESKITRWPTLSPSITAVYGQAGNYYRKTAIAYARETASMQADFRTGNAWATGIISPYELYLRNAFTREITRD